MKFYTSLVYLSLLALMSGCQTTANMDFKQPNNDKGRTIILGGDEYSEGEPWEFLSWKCRDYSYGGKILVEVGKTALPEDYKSTIEYQELPEEQKQKIDKFMNYIGFVLYDGTDIGDFTLYHRDGLSHRWDWGEGSSYSFVIKTDGTGLYYDFSTADKDGKKSKADDIFKCSR